jgi:hypothetical protein
MTGFGRSHLEANTADGQVTCRQQRMAAPLAVDLMVK